MTKCVVSLLGMIQVNWIHHNLCFYIRKHWRLPSWNSHSSPSALCHHVFVSNWRKVAYLHQTGQGACSDIPHGDWEYWVSPEHQFVLWIIFNSESCLLFKENHWFQLVSDLNIQVITADFRLHDSKNLWIKRRPVKGCSSPPIYLTVFLIHTICEMQTFTIITTNC